MSGPESWLPVISPPVHISTWATNSVNQSVTKNVTTPKGDPKQ